MRFSVRREDRRNLVVGFIGLISVMTAHSIMETARDTLFLTSLPATHLPRAYLAIAVLAILELKVHERVLRHVSDRRMLLSASLLFGAFVTLGFWALLDELGAWAPFGFYVWTGLLITVVLVEFWLLLDDAVTVTQAKRIFPAIAAGGVSGAMLGSLIADGLLRIAPPMSLVFAAALILALASATPLLWKMPSEVWAERRGSEQGASFTWLLRDSYLSRVLMLVLMGTIALTVVDFIFKSAVAENISAERLGHFFARFYFGLNSVALLVQLVGAGWLLRAFGVHRSSALLPVLIFGGAFGLVLGPVLVFAVALKAVDGSLRHTLYRSSVEVLYLTLDSRQRERAKGIIEVFGHRVGQALASLLIIAAVGVGLSTPQFAVVLVFLVAGWIAAIMSTRHQYVNEFRARLRHGTVDLDLEQLIASDEEIARSKILHALGRSQACDPSPVFDDVLLQEQLRESLLRTSQLLQWRAAMEVEGMAETPDAEVLRVALREKERAALERTFWIMDLWHAEENFNLVWRGLTSDDARLQAASREVLEAALSGSFREAVLAVIDDGEPPGWRARAAATALGETVRPISGREAMEQMVQDQSEVLRSMAISLLEARQPASPISPIEGARWHSKTLK
jgi:AAA family ATP:ADP antiporter